MSISFMEYFAELFTIHVREDWTRRRHSLVNLLDQWLAKERGDEYSVGQISGGIEPLTMTPGYISGP